MDGDAPGLKFVDLLLVGDEHSCLRDERDSQRCAQREAALLTTPHLFHISHIIPHAM
ncbi:hypothetical protein [Streptomyces sasae]|uniref:hypothetical protein n=1 Tax=Streptomyces sasae TaxID=1266772 RepID=UPI00292F626D|nr:hypothetical protein [Streptomyces sasae]